jgi:hypothetical protein
MLVLGLRSKREGCEKSIQPPLRHGRPLQHPQPALYRQLPAGVPPPSLVGDVWATGGPQPMPCPPQVVTDASVFNPKGDQAAKVECDVLLHRRDRPIAITFLLIALSSQSLRGHGQPFPGAAEGCEQQPCEPTGCQAPGELHAGEASRQHPTSASLSPNPGSPPMRATRRPSWMPGWRTQAQPATLPCWSLVP